MPSLPVPTRWDSVPRSVLSLWHWLGHSSQADSGTASCLPKAEPSSFSSSAVPPTDVVCGGTTAQAAGIHRGHPAS